MPTLNIPVSTAKEIMGNEFTIADNGDNVVSVGDTFVKTDAAQKTTSAFTLGQDPFANFNPDDIDQMSKLLALGEKTVKIVTDNRSSNTYLAVSEKGKKSLETIYQTGGGRHYYEPKTRIMDPQKVVGKLTSKYPYIFSEPMIPCRQSSLKEYKICAVDFVGIYQMYNQYLVSYSKLNEQFVSGTLNDYTMDEATRLRDSLIVGIDHFLSTETK